MINFVFCFFFFILFLFLYETLSAFLCVSIFFQFAALFALDCVSLSLKEMCHVNLFQTKFVNTYPMDEVKDTDK